MKSTVKGLIIPCGLVVISLTSSGGRTTADEAATPAADVSWHTSYKQARDLAEAERKMLFVYFHDGEEDAAETEFDSQVLARPAIARRLARFVRLRLRRRAKFRLEGATENTVLLEHASFGHMHGKPGIAIIDFSNPDAGYYSHVVSAFPFAEGKHYPADRVQAILDLPPGTITQRTLIYAVRTYPDGPKSASGKLHPALLKSATWHSQHMASRQLQGHHNWESRFHELAAEMPGHLVPTEVTAESWPGETLVEAAEECVYCWRQSSGHWNSVVGDHPIYAYDMKRGAGGLWYATGIFGKRR